MKCVLILILLAASAPAMADDCDATAARVSEATGAELVRRNAETRNFRHPEVPDLQVRCRPNSQVEPYVSIYLNKPFPSAVAQRVFGTAGAIHLGLLNDEIAKATRACASSALKKDAPTTVRFPSGVVECTATDAGTGSFSAMVSRR